MKKLALLCLLALPVLAATPLGTAPEGFQHWSLGSLQAPTQALTAKAAADAHHVASQQLADFPNELFLLAHRDADGQPEWHENQIDVFLVQSGSGTLVVGGTLTNADAPGPHEKRGGTIEGGTRQKISTGDIVRIPARTPHQILLDGSHSFTYFVVKVKGY